MKRHSDGKAYIDGTREYKKLEWGGRVGDRGDGDRNNRNMASASAAKQGEVATSQHRDSSDSGTPLLSSMLTPNTGEIYHKDESVMLSIASSTSSAGKDAARGGRLVKVGEHHEGSFGVYMAHKIDKLRSQVDGTVTRLEGSEGSVFKGVLAHINGYTTVPVATLRELLASRGGVVEAYNTSRCTHMICETLPYAKVKELRKLLRPPTVVRSAWVEDSARAGRKLPAAEYMVDGVFLQKRTLAASFAAAITRKPSSGSERETIALSASISAGRQASGGMAVPSVFAPRCPVNGLSAKASAFQLADSCEARRAALRGIWERQEPGEESIDRTLPVDHPKVDCMPVSNTCTSTRDEDAAIAGATLRQPEIFRNKLLETPPLPGEPPVVFSGKNARSSRSSEGLLTGAEKERKGSNKNKMETNDGGGGLPPFELDGMGAAGEGGRTTKDDPAFMKTFFQKSRLHFIGVGRARAVKLVNSGLAARAQPGSTQPVFRGILGRGEMRVILHVDMDCFFVSVLVKNRPDLLDKPVAVAHNASSSKGAGSSEVSSCNYLARAQGVKAGMFMMKAKELCPQLVVLRYDFEAYSEASDKMYGVFLRYAPVVMAVSCDEAFLELPKESDPVVAAEQIRRSIFEETGCPASAGVSSNMLLARMATKEAKPNGQFWLQPEVAMRHMGPLPVQELPGVGWKLRRRLNDEGIITCSDLWPLSAIHLQKGLGLGEKTGQALWEACRGIDKRLVQPPPDRKSIGAEVNYGVRFDTQAQADGFLSKLAVELSIRMATEGVVGRALTLKIMKQRDGVGLPRKYLGHGICDARSKLVNLRRATADRETLASYALRLLKESQIPPEKIRGIGLQMTRLDPTGEDLRSDSGSDGGKMGGALHEWLIKSNEGDSSSTLSLGEARQPPCEKGEHASPSEGKVAESLNITISPVAEHGTDREEGEPFSQWPQTPEGRQSSQACKKQAREKDHAVSSNTVPLATCHHKDQPLAVSYCREVASAVASKKKLEPGAEVHIESTASVKEQNIQVVEHLAVEPAAEVEFSVFVGNDALVSKPQEHKLGVRVGASQLDGKISDSFTGDNISSPPARLKLSPGSPEWLSPDTPAHRVVGTPLNCAGSPSLSQITFSQVDNTVLSALPPDLRQEVVAQLEARQRQRRTGDVLSSPLPSPSHPSTHGDEQVPTRSGGNTLVETSLAGGVREGFDITVREYSTKPQQVSLDNLWTLHKLREDGDGSGGGPSVFDRDSLRAMPLGLGLQYASLSEKQRTQVARRYAQAPGPGTDGAHRDSFTTCAAIAAQKSTLPPSPSYSSGASVRGSNNHRSPPQRVSNHPFSPGIASSPVLEGGETAVGRLAPSPRSAELHRISLSQVDREVLDSLPQEVREEVLRTIASTASGGVAGVEGLGIASRSDQGRGSKSSGESSVGGKRNSDSVRSRSPLSRSQLPQWEDPRLDMSENKNGESVFEIERLETLRGALRVWVGGTVRSPSQWHLELLYRYFEELVEDGRLDETATLLRCLERLSKKADMRVQEAGASSVEGGGGWVMGYCAVLEAVQNLVREKTDGASLSLIC